MKPPPNCHTIPPCAPFIRTLAGWILEHYGQDAAALTSVLILLPSRRACRALRESFLELTGGKPLLLPRIRPIGDSDEALSAAHYAYMGDIPPAISPVRRELLLARLVTNFLRKQAGEEGDASPNIELARQLARFIDDAAREGLSFERLSALVPQELAMHWQQTLDFLTVISQHWPGILVGEGALDPVEQRNRLLAATAKRWQEHPPAHPVIAAGSTGSQPATAALLATIAHLPQGNVILPGLDTAMEQAQWDMLTPTHPQFGMKQLLEKMECKRETIYPLRVGEHTIPSPRTVCINALMQPPEATAGWTRAQLDLEQGLSGMRLLVADTQFDEARMIAIALRETLETPEKTAALVTPDRQLARMVAAQMERFGVTIDDSAGKALMDTPPATFLRIAVEMVASQAAPAPLLALLRHPLVSAGREPAQCRLLSRVLEMELLRGIRLKPGLETLRDASKNKEVCALLGDLAQHTKPLAACFAKTSATLHELLSAHIALAQWLAGEALWAGEAGNQLAEFTAELLQHSDTLGPVEPLSYPGLFTALLAGQTWRPRYGLHPRLHILSPIEARLLHFDLMILGGLNEGMWPSSPQADPWMSRPMRAAFGLPESERTIGQSAHDIVMLSHAREVIWSRSRKVEGAPCVPSRWLVRLETLVGGLDDAFLHNMHCEHYFVNGMNMLDAPQGMPKLARPQPLPPLEARPKKMSVTNVDTWLRDPYIIYAKYILKLRKLEALDREPDAADFGTLAHSAIEQFTNAWPEALPDNPYEKLLAYGREAFAPFDNRPAVASLWWPRFEAMAAWLVSQETQRRGALSQVMGEVGGAWDFAVDGKNFTLTTTIDRLEIDANGAALIADYKTGYVPSSAEIDRGLANQLSLEALIALHGTLTPAATLSSVTAAEYWKLTGNSDDCEIIAAGQARKEGMTAWLADTKERLEMLIRRFNDASVPYAAQDDPALEARFNDYEQLIRKQEWDVI